MATDVVNTSSTYLIPRRIPNLPVKILLQSSFMHLWFADIVTTAIKDAATIN